MNELLDRVDEIIKEHGLLTGREFLDLTGNDMPLYRAYLGYWDSVVMPDTLDAIQSRIDELEK